MKKHVWPFAEIAIYLILVAVISPFLATWIQEAMAQVHSHEEKVLAGQFLSVAMIMLLSYGSFYLAHRKPIPSFVGSLLVGIAASPLLAPHTGQTEILRFLVSIGAAYILFQGGLETPFVNFRKLFWKIFMLAFPGVLISAYALSQAVSWSGEMLGATVTATTAVLLGAILASTDPAAIVPLLKPLRFKRNTTKDIVVSESAMNDVVGALLTITLLGLVGTVGFISINAGYAGLFSPASGMVLLKQMGFGLLAGLIGYVLLRLLNRHKRDHGFESGADGAFFLFVPAVTFVLALLTGGSGYLAVFIAGLLFNLTERLQKTAHFFEEHLIDGYAKPIIFLLLGALVDLPALLQFAPIGLLVSAIFVFILRPLMVILMLGGFTVIGKDKMTWSEIFFISWVRETGAIPAVLLVTVMSSNIPGTEALLPIGMWVILFTLIVQPLLTPWWAKRLGLVESEASNPATAG